MTNERGCNSKLGKAMLFASVPCSDNTAVVSEFKSRESFSKQMEASSYTECIFLLWFIKGSSAAAKRANQVGKRESNSSTAMKIAGKAAAVASAWDTPVLNRVSGVAGGAA